MNIPGWLNDQLLRMQLLSGTPGLVVDGKVLSAGKVPSVEEIGRLL